MTGTTTSRDSIATVDTTSSCHDCTGVKPPSLPMTTTATVETHLCVKPPSLPMTTTATRGVAQDFTRWVLFIRHQMSLGRLNKFELVELTKFLSVGEALQVSLLNKEYHGKVFDLFFGRIYFAADRDLVLVDGRMACGPRVLVLTDQSQSVPEGFEVLDNVVDSQWCMPIKYCLLRVLSRGSENMVRRAVRYIEERGFTFDQRFHIVNALIPQSWGKIFYFNAYAF